MSKLLGQRLRRAIRFIVQQAERRATAETDVKTAYQSQRESAAEEFNRREQHIQDELTRAQENAVNTYQIKTRSIEERFNSAHSNASQKWNSAKETNDTELEEAKEKRKEEYKESRWTTESVFEADKKVAKDELALRQRQVGKDVQEFDAAHHEITRFLKRWKMDRIFDAIPDPQEKCAEQADTLAALSQCVATHQALLDKLQRLFIPKLLNGFRLLGIFALLWVISSTFALLIEQWYIWVGATFLAVLSTGLATRFVLALGLRNFVANIGAQIKKNAADSAWLHRLCLKEATNQHKIQLREVQEKYENAVANAKATFIEYREQLNENHRRESKALRARYEPYLAKLTEKRDDDLRAAEAEYQQAMTASETRFNAEMNEVAAKKERLFQEIHNKHESGRKELIRQWTVALEQFGQVVEAIRTEANSLFPGWSALTAKDRPISKQVPLGMRFGQINITPQHIPHSIPGDAELAELKPQCGELPALLDFPHRGSLLIKAGGEGRAKAIQLLQAVMLRCLLSLPPGKVRFTIIDPVGRGENFAAFSHLADFEDKLVTSRIWTEPDHVEKRLSDLTEHIEIVIQKYLRNQFNSLEEYNAQAGEVSEPYRILVIAHFPVNFTDESAKRLLSIAQSGLRCGIQTLILVDNGQPLPDHFDMRDLEAAAAVLTWKDNKFVWQDDDFGRFPLTLDSPPHAETCTDLLQMAGERARNAGRVEVPFAQIAPAPKEWWTATSRDGIRVALGKAGATRKQLLELGDGTSQHALIAGKTGSGKSNLLHALIVQLALAYSPDEVEMYLVDFKKGVEFKTYANYALPHARVVAIESEREFGLSVLRRLDAELRMRGEKFRELGVHDILTCRQATDAPLPRVLLIVDEFQEFFVEDDRIAQDAALLLDRLVRQGRAFGIHILLGSQTLGGAYSLARSTIDQMAVRIALQCSETDGHLILNKDNSAARLLSRPGEAIYNNANGLIEGNHLFQVVWMPDQSRDQSLKQIQRLAAKYGAAERDLIVFEGNAPALLHRNAILHKLLESEAPAVNGSNLSAWLGDAIAIKDPTAAVFRRQSGCNLLIVGQQSEAALNIMAAALIGLAAAIRIEDPEANHSVAENPDPGSGSPNAAQTSDSQSVRKSDFYLICDDDDEIAGPLFQQLTDGLPHRAKIAGWNDIAETASEIAKEVKSRTERRDTGNPKFLFICGLHQFRNLRRQEDEFGLSRSRDGSPDHPAQNLAAILQDGPSVGVFSIVWCDTFNNLQRFLDRRLLREFEMRVLFQMNANDSSNLIDSPVASKLGFHRALFYTEGQGRLEKFRPYGPPPQNWLAWVKERMHRTIGVRQKNTYQPDA